MYKDTLTELVDEREMLASGEPMPRPPGTPTPCHICPKVPLDRRAHATPKDAIEPTPETWDILWHYRQCKAVGRFPVDELVEAHAGIITEQELSIERTRAVQQTGLLNLIANGSRR